MGLYNNRLQKRLEWGNNIRDTLGCHLFHFFRSYHNLLIGILRLTTL
ncbi:unnamed protein product [Pocillopora meandrina]|uniref:Uncharacterized protein n=1 Tax=Pocillopora meandrina TaxID=46732 RepID=A0AAU9WR40_9CNID|nr:unnamed protein product [Pocillopora meandrina]